MMMMIFPILCFITSECMSMEYIERAPSTTPTNDPNAIHFLPHTIFSYISILIVCFSRPGVGGLCMYVSSK